MVVLNTPNALRLTFFHKAFVIPFITLLIQYLDEFMFITVKLDREDDLRTLNVQNQDNTFDYIIVGSGSAGSIIASRLTEDSSVKVLLLEAGGLPSPILSLPVISYIFNNQKSHDWAHRTVPQSKAAFALNNNISNWPSGKTLGGSSSINGLINIRGNVQGFDLIASRTGDPLWKLENVLKFYKKLETYNGWFDKGSHGKDGTLSIESPILVPCTKYLLRAGEELGYRIRDPNADGPHVEGFSPVEFYLRRGARSSSYTNPLKRDLKRPNLILRKYSIVTKLLFAPGSVNEVTGVEYERHGTKYFATATKETILSAGVLSTPKILMLSGIGPKEHLTRMKIPVRVDLPVGQRLQDKYGALVGPFIVPKGYSFDQYRDLNITSVLQWLAFGEGPMAAGRTEATYSLITKKSKLAGDIFAPDIHTYIISQTPVRPESTFGYSFNFNEATLAHFKKSTNYGDSFFQLVTNSRGVGTGFVRLRDSNPHSPLIVNPKYLQNTHDVERLVEGIRFSVNLVENTTAMKEIGAKLFDVPLPGCEGVPFKSDEYFECFARHATITAYKYCGTASIGNETDPEAVVDSRFRVMKTKGLRVVDGSLLRINEVNTNDVTVRMLGELAAHVLKGTGHKFNYSTAKIHSTFVTG